MSDLRESHRRGMISRVPCYNSIFNYLEDEGLTPILRELIRQSSCPLPVWKLISPWTLPVSALPGTRAGLTTSTAGCGKRRNGSKRMSCAESKRTSLPPWKSGRNVLAIVPLCLLSLTRLQGHLRSLRFRQMRLIAVRSTWPRLQPTTERRSSLSSGTQPRRTLLLFSGRCFTTSNSSGKISCSINTSAAMLRAPFRCSSANSGIRCEARLIPPW